MGSKLKSGLEWPQDMTFPDYWIKQYAKTQGIEGLKDARRRAFHDTKSLLKVGLEETPDEWQHVTILHNLFHVGILQGEVRTFSFSKELLTALKATDIRNLPDNVVKVPFPLMYFDLSQGDLLPTIKKDDEGKHDELRNPRGCAVIQVGDLGDVPDFSLMPASYLPNKKHSKTRPPYVLSFMGLRSEDGEFLFLDEAKDMDESDTEILTLSINALLYINSSNADIKEEWVYAPNLKGRSKPVKKLEKQKQRRLGKVYRVGFNIQLPQHCDITTGESGKGRKLEIRFQVRGHWRHQWYGPRKNAEGQKQKGDKQELLWIPPCWKGPEMADVVHRDYDVHSKPTME